MRWLVKNGAAIDAAPQDVPLPETIVPGESFALDKGGTATWNRTHRTLVLTDARGVERNVRVRSSSLVSFDGDPSTQVALEFVIAAPRGVESFAGTVEPFVPGHANRGRAGAGKALLVRSQITGKILKIMVKVGDHIAAGDALMIIEAMKMENRIFAQHAGIVAQVTVQEGDSVATGKELVRLAGAGD